MRRVTTRIGMTMEHPLGFFLPIVAWLISDIKTKAKAPVLYYRRVENTFFLARKPLIFCDLKEKLETFSIKKFTYQNEFNQ